MTCTGSRRYGTYPLLFPAFISLLLAAANCIIPKNKIMDQLRGKTAMECKVKHNREGCTCTYEPCSRKGICCECIEYHWKKGQFPGCFFPRDVEAGYDRSIERFIKTYQERGKWW